MIELRPYQRECIESIPESGAYLIQMATGLGKTVTFSQIPRRGRMLILSHREELTEQPRKYFDCSFGIERAGFKSHGEEVVSASVQTISRRLDRFDPSDFDLIITDEAHHAAAGTYKKIFEYFKPRLHLGFTATPVRGDYVRLDDVYSKIIFEYPLLRGIKEGYLSNIDCWRVNIGYDLSNVHKRMGDYSPKELDSVMNDDANNKAIGKIYKEHAVGPTMIFAVSVSHAEGIAREIPGAVAVSGNTKDRASIVKAFKRGEIPCLVNCMVFTEGTDIPNIQTIIMARPTQSAALYTQMVGRGTRLYPEKENLKLIDVVGVSQKLDLCTAPTLIGIDTDSVPADYKDEIEGFLPDLPELVAEKADTPESWIRNIENVDIWARKNHYSTHNINFFKLPDGSLVNMLSSGHKHVIPPADSTGKTKYGLTMQQLIDRLYKHLNKEHGAQRPLWDLTIAKRWGAYQATDKQKQFIKKKPRGRSVNVNGLTRLQAAQIITRINI